jgi:predicted nucleic acid-binding protein
MYLADTNILLRFLLPNDPAYPTIRQAVRTLKTQGEQIVTTSQNIVEFWNVCTRPTTARGGLGLSIEATERRVRLLERHFRVFSDNSSTYEQWKTLVLAHHVRGVQVHDARIVAAMLVSGVDNILTTNVRISSVILVSMSLHPKTLFSGISFCEVTF